MIAAEMRFALLAFVLMFAGCTDAALRSYSPPRPLMIVRNDRSLTAGQRNVVLAIMRAGPAVFHRSYNAHFGPEDVFYAVPNGILVLYYGDRRFPSGVMPPGYAQCPKTQPEGCGQANWIIGSGNLIYYPAPQGAPGSLPGVRLTPGPTERLRPLDVLVRRAYAKYRVPAPWNVPWRVWAS
jgi:hypothetical protein